MASPKLKNGVQQLDYLVENASAIYNELKVLEQSIYDLETRYLESTTAQGNIFRGWEAYLDNKPASSSAASSSSSSSMAMSSCSSFATAAADCDALLGACCRCLVPPCDPEC